MNYSFEPDEKNRLLAVRETPAVRLLINTQFAEAVLITYIIECGIEKSGAFTDKLGDYAIAFARTEKISPAKAEMILREIFKARTGQTMNQRREALAEREARLTDDETARVLDHALAIGRMIEEGGTIAFHRAFAHQAQLLGRELGITHAAAKRFMKEAFKETRCEELYDWGKALEEKFFKPKIGAEKARSTAGRGERRASQARLELSL